MYELGESSPGSYSTCSGNKKETMKEKSKFAQAAKTVMNAVNSAVSSVQLSMEADSPSQVFEVHFKLKNSYLNDTYRVGYLQSSGH